jgi:hypothetical protein
MTAVPFDTLALARALRDKAHFTPEQAEGAAEALATAISEQTATKADIAEVRGDLAILRAELAVVKWVTGGVGFGVLLLVLKSFWPA